MNYDRSQRSELERRFEVLFQQVFRCPVESVLIPQYPVIIDGRSYFIDYVFLNGTENIAIELDGHGKIKEAADSSQQFERLLSRQNDLVKAGFKVYRLTWSQVVHQNGWHARKLLVQLFQGKTQANHGSLAVSQGQIASWNIKPNATATVVDYIPKKKGGDIIGLLAFIVVVFVSFYGAIILFANSQVSEPVNQSKETSIKVKTPTQAVINIHAKTANSAKKSVSNNKKPIASPVAKKTEVTIQVAHKPDKARQPSPTQSQVLPQQESPAIHAIEPVAAPIAKEIEQPASEIQKHTEAPADELVAFNQKTLYFHKPGSYWATRCTRNCVYIPKSQAIQAGGHPAASMQP